MSSMLNPPTGSDRPINPILVDKVVYILQDALASLPWIGLSLGRIYPRKVDGKTQPWLHRYEGIGKENKDYYLAYPNDELSAAFSCIYLHDDESPDENEVYLSQTLSVIIWANLKKLGIDNPSVEILKRDVYKVLANVYAVESIKGAVSSTDSGAGAIYPGFDLSALQAQYNTYPFGAFRVEVVVKYADLCY